MYELEGIQEITSFNFPLNVKVLLHHALKTALYPLHTNTFRDGEYTDVQESYVVMAMSNCFV